ncbi:M13 family metallopeptidase [Ponticaulis sp.]|uniref:M13 family metallopeptidase n=1 Tax=Ponticaulis sp. TaxID=2020902 RepID=UPI000B700D84|nr:M13 family metallopeptidase [Ponticaulis sp.]MAI90168.1 zinc metalloprotease [Ponticaulis sp.]OUX99819.1 MAG: zinc metalloprotease [Hyphomonadaceae bacterium TMED5]|tara:strand:- start:126886 stop:129036 length:2151 start_codon:yes stop_codon:yes gene_type:complete
MKNLLLATSAMAMLGLAACTPSEAPETDASAAPEETAAAPSPTFGTFGIETANIDENTAPGDDFNRYVNGQWLDTFEIPSDRSRYGVFNMLADEAEIQVREIIEDAAASEASVDTLEGKISAFYNAYMDTETINAAGLAPAQPYLDRIAAIETREDLAAIFAATGFRAPIGGYVDVDARNPEAYIFYVGQGGLGLPDRSYYLNDTPNNLEVREAYLGFLTTMLETAGYEDPAAAAQTVYDLEHDMAEAHWDRAIGRNRNLTYNNVTREELIEMGNGFPVEVLLNDMGLGAQETFVVRQVTPTAEEIEEQGLSEEQLALLGDGVSGLLEIANTAPIEAWQAYLTAHFLSGHADVLPTEIDDARFAFYGQVLSGQPEQRPRWKRAVGATEGALGEAVGQIYVDLHFQPEAKDAMVDLVENLRTAMEANLEDLEWMGPETRVEALDKLAKFTPKIGYPENFESYDDLAIVEGDAFANEMAVAEWQYADMLSQLGQPIDTDEWFMYPQTVNAYYSPNRNEIVFPAAILQPPFFDLYADPAVNYGAIGAVIGHEMGHGFDDQGARSDGDGLLRNWWTAEDEAAFQERTDALVDQYNGFCPIENSEEDTVCVNGRLTLGENIGDLGGLSMAYRAYQISLNGEEAPVIDGYTGDQRFFMSWAQVWQALYREEAQRQQLATDPHSPPMYRINGIVRNMDQWYEAFEVSEDDALYLPPEERITIW